MIIENIKINSSGLKKRIALIFTFSLISLAHHGQLWLDLDSGFRCGPHFSYVYQLLGDNENKTITACGLIRTHNCEEYYVPAIWDGTAWRKTGVMSNGDLIFNPIIEYKDELYAGNKFFGQNKNSLVHFNGQYWDTIPIGFYSSLITDFIEYDDVLYGAGGYSIINGDTSDLAFKFDGNEVEVLVDYPDITGRANCLAFYHDTLFVGGRFWENQSDINHLASIYDRDIHQVGQGLGIDANVEAMVVYDGKLWLGGIFHGEYFGGSGYVYLIYYDGHALHLAPHQTNGRVVSMEVYENELYVSGWFSEIDGMESHGVAKLNQFGSFVLNPDTIYDSYDAPASVGPNIVMGIAIMNDTLYIGGQFSRIGSCDNLNSIAKLNKSLTGKNIPLQSNFIIYPNPTLGELVLETNSYFNQSAPIRMYDSSGRLVLEDIWLLGERQKRISLSSFSNGAYILQLETNGEKLSRTIIKE